MHLLIKDVRIVDAEKDLFGSIITEDDRILGFCHGDADPNLELVDMAINGMGLTLLPALVDMHAHFRDTVLPGHDAPEAETLESACLAAARGGYGTLVCMANTQPPIDSLEAALGIRERARRLGLADVYPAVSLTEAMEGKKVSSALSTRAKLNRKEQRALPYKPPLASEDGKDVVDDALFTRAVRAAAKSKTLVSCHCGELGDDAGSIIRAISYSIHSGKPIHLAHLCDGETVQLVREMKKTYTDEGTEAPLSCETTPSYFASLNADLIRMGFPNNRVNPPIGDEDDRSIIQYALKDNTIDCIATDHAPHSPAAKSRGAPGYSALETAFPVSFTNLVMGNILELQQLSRLMSYNPARLLQFNDRGLIDGGFRADLILVDTKQRFTLDAQNFASRGTCTPFDRHQVYGKIVTTIHGGRVVYQA
jgi:dihydroorotase